MDTCLQHHLLVRPLQLHAPLAKRNLHGSKLPTLAVERRAHGLIHCQKPLELRRRSALSCGEPLLLGSKLSVKTLLLRALQRGDGAWLRGGGAAGASAAARFADGQPELLLELLLRVGHLPELIFESEAVRTLLVEAAPELRSLCAAAVAFVLQDLEQRLRHAARFHDPTAQNRPRLLVRTGDFFYKKTKRTGRLGDRG
eukprot:scaffold13460_cov116-Isochrysis_galbana.AAC.6